MTIKINYIPTEYEIECTVFKKTSYFRIMGSIEEESNE